MGVGHERQPLVVIYRPQDETAESHRRIVDAGCRLEILDLDDDLDQALQRLSPVDGILTATVRGDGLTRARLRAMPELRIVAKYTIGVDDVDVAAATDLGILVTHSPTEANWGGVAEGTVALMLALLKKLEIRSRRVKAGKWRSDDLRGVYLGAREDGYAGITIGIVGFGRIGRRVAGLMAPWKVRLIAADPYIDAGTFADHGVERVSLDALLNESDVVSLHCSLTDETKGMLNEARIAAMKPGAVLINTARGAMVDIDAVCSALDDGRLGGAAFDVLPEEPPPPTSKILRTDERVILSPHMIAANQGGTLEAAIPWATDAVLAALRGETPAHVYNPEAIGAWRSRFAAKPLL